MSDGPQIDRRTLLLGGLAAGIVAVAGACGSTSGNSSAGGSASPTTKVSAAPTSTTTRPLGPPALPPGQPATFAPHGPSGADRRVALTFHTNGDLGIDQALLDVLDRRQVRITAFIVGNWLDAHPEWAKKLVGAGHELANHTYTHPTFANLSRAAMSGEVERCRDTLARLTGGGGSFFRPSGTDDGTHAPPAVVQEVAAEAGYPMVLGFDVDPLDYQDPGAAAVAARTLAAVTAGSIVSLHFGHAGTVAAVPTVLDGLAARGLTPVTASQLFGWA
jgi:peptidoglycan/xylan/chitin deacetylase (PgdA/CDA1 family)